MGNHNGNIMYEERWLGICERNKELLVVDKYELLICVIRKLNFEFGLPLLYLGDGQSCLLNEEEEL